MRSGASVTPTARNKRCIMALTPQPARGRQHRPCLCGEAAVAGVGPQGQPARGQPRCSPAPAVGTREPGAVPPILAGGGKAVGVRGSTNIPSMSSVPELCHLSRHFFVRARWEQLGLLSQTAGCRSAEQMNAQPQGTHLLLQHGEVATRTGPVAHKGAGSKQRPGGSAGTGWWRSPTAPPKGGDPGALSPHIAPHPWSIPIQLRWRCFAAGTALLAAPAPRWTQPVSHHRAPPLPAPHRRAAPHSSPHSDHFPALPAASSSIL